MPRVLQRRTIIYSAAFTVFLILPLVVFQLFSLEDKENPEDPLEAHAELTSQVVEESLYFGFHPDSFSVFEGEISPNEFLSSLLLPHKVPYGDIAKLEKAVSEVYSVRQLRSGRNYAVLNRDTSDGADYFIYHPNPYNYVVYSLKDSLYASVESHPVDTVIKTGAGVINHSLWMAMSEASMDKSLISKMEDAFAWVIDFYHIQEGDKFKLFYEEKQIDGEAVGIGRLLGANFIDKSGDNYAIYFENDTYSGYYDLEGRPMKRAFLRAPVKYSRISSRYNPRRLHPVLRRLRPHLGTDYAAPHGTEIYSVADGVVSKAGYTGGNGNYVKIRHDNTYETQYLHMSRFAKGIRSGTRVKQGQTIGYVGSTGLATGPHVCFRFWKNGVQVDHLKENLPPPEPMSESGLREYYVHRDGILPTIVAIEFPRENQIPVQFANESIFDPVSSLLSQ